MYIVTGGAGFIGSNIVEELVRRGKRVLVVDNITDAKVRNMPRSELVSFMDAAVFSVMRDQVISDKEIEGIFHQGACSNTRHPDPRHVMNTNTDFSIVLLHSCIREKKPVVYASSAAVYGLSDSSAEYPENEKPLNVYGFSKLLVDRYVRKAIAGLDMTVPLVGLRYFNVYGSNEAHKGTMASMVRQIFDMRGGPTRIFFDGTQRRDFVHVSDVVKVNMHFMFGKPQTGIFNVGTGVARSFKEVAEIVNPGFKISYQKMPQELKHMYQDYTCADLTRLRKMGEYHEGFLSLEAGVDLSAVAWSNGQ